MVKWQYEHRCYRVVDVGSQSLLIPQTHKGLNEMGREGWEVVSMVQDSLQYNVWFKRLADPIQ